MKNKAGDDYYYVGIDPGKSGGIAWLNPDGSCAHMVDMPDTEHAIFEALSGVSFAHHKMVAVIERVHSFPGQGVASSFTFGMGYGGLRMALIALGIPFEEVEPSKWQNQLDIPPRRKRQGKRKEESKSHFKKRLIARAEQVFPGERVTNKTADALLIALYCRRRHNGAL